MAAPLSAPRNEPPVRVSLFDPVLAADISVGQMATGGNQRAAAASTSGGSVSGPRGLFPVDSDTHLLDRLNAAYKYRYVAVTVFLLVMLGVLIRTYTTTPMYRATASLLIEDDRGKSVAGFASPSAVEYHDPEP